MNQDQDTQDLLRWWPALGRPCTQQYLADLVGVTQGAISRHISAGHIPRDGTALEQIRAYLAHLKAEAERQTGDGIMSLPAERAALARAQREAWEMRNERARSEYAPAQLLREMLATISADMVANIDQLPARIEQAAPNLPESARAALLSTIASARAEWIRSTANLVDRSLNDPSPDDAIDGQTDSDDNDAS